MHCYHFKHPSEILPKVLDLCEENYRILLKHGYLSIFNGNVRFQVEIPGQNCFLNILEILQKGFADCEDLASALIAMCWYLGIEARPILYTEWVNQLKSVSHVSVEVCIGNRWIEIDPSIMLGMRGDE